MATTTGIKTTPTKTEMTPLFLIIQNRTTRRRTQMNLSAQSLRKFGSLALAGGLFLISSAASAGELAWKKHTVNDQSEFEAAGALDVDNDGDLDIVSGSFWYEAPSWKKHNVRDVIRQGTYYNCFSTLPVDANADGFMDFITVSYFGRSIGWVENPKETGKKWTYHEVDLGCRPDRRWQARLSPKPHQCRGLVRT